MKPLPEITPATRPFWDGCAAGELRVQRCEVCGSRQFPPRARCLACGGAELDWQAVEPAGEVHSFTVVHRAPSAAFRPDVPYVVALVDVAPRARLMMNLVDVDEDQVRIGMQVRIGFESRNDGDRGLSVPVARAIDGE